MKAIVISSYILFILFLTSCLNRENNENLDLNGSWWFIQDSLYCELHYNSSDSLLEIWHGDYECISGPKLEISTNEKTILKLYKAENILANLELITQGKDSISFFDIDNEKGVCFYRQESIELNGLEKVSSDSLLNRIRDFYTRMDSFYLDKVLEVDN